MKSLTENSKEKIHHRITLNNKEYIVFSGEVIRDNMDKVETVFKTATDHCQILSINYKRIEYGNV